MKHTPNVLLVNAIEDSKKLGLSRTMNVILLGAMAGNTTILPFSADQLRTAIQASVPTKYSEINLKAFDLGLTYKI